MVMLMVIVRDDEKKSTRREREGKKEKQRAKKGRREREREKEFPSNYYGISGSLRILLSATYTIFLSGCHPVLLLFFFEIHD